MSLPNTSGQGAIASLMTDPVTSRAPSLRVLTVADLSDWESLPEKTRALARRVFGMDESMWLAEPGDNALVDAYEAGWEDCAHEMEAPDSWQTPKQILERLKAGR